MGFDWRAFAAIGKLIAPAILAASHVPPALIPLVMHGIELAETDPGKTGAEKKAFVLEAVATGVAGINAVKPGLINPQWPALVGTGIDLTVNTINAVRRQPVPEGVVLPPTA